MKHKLIITALCIVAGITTLNAQHELSINTFGGFHPLSMTLTGDGSASGSIGYGAGIGYNFNFNQNWSIGSGMDFSFYRATIKFNRFEHTYIGYDNFEGENFEFTAETNNFKENASVLFLEIPLTARYSLPLGAANSLRFTGGFKFGLPLTADYTASAVSLSTRGNYLYENQLYHSVPGVFENKPMGELSGSWDANISVQLTFEVAYRFAIAGKYGLSLGAYLNYGLNDLQGTKNAPPIAFEVNRNNPYSSNSMLDSGFASSVRPLAVGLRLRFDLGL
jgi:hypothetical protein